MDNPPRQETTWDRLSLFAQRRFTGVAGHATAVVDGALTLVSVEVAGPFHNDTSACIKKSINRALTAARRELAQLLASDPEIDLPTVIRDVLNGADIEQYTDSSSEILEAEHIGVVIKIGGKESLVTWVDTPSPRHLFLLPRVVNAVLNRLESGNSEPPMAAAFESSWAEITDQLAGLDSRLDEISAEYGSEQT